MHISCLLAVAQQLSLGNFQLTVHLAGTFLFISLLSLLFPQLRIRTVKGIQQFSQTRQLPSVSPPLSRCLHILSGLFFHPSLPPDANDGLRSIVGLFLFSNCFLAKTFVRILDKTRQPFPSISCDQLFRKPALDYVCFAHSIR